MKLAVAFGQIIDGFLMHIEVGLALVLFFDREGRTTGAGPFLTLQVFFKDLRRLVIVFVCEQVKSLRIVTRVATLRKQPRAAQKQVGGYQGQGLRACVDFAAHTISWF